MKRAAAEEEAENEVLVPLLTRSRPSLVPGIKLKADHENRPLYVTREKRVYVEAWSAWHEQSSDFVVTIADPVQRLDLVHEYAITEASIFGALSIGLDAASILQTLARLTKHNIPEEVSSFVTTVSEMFGRVCLVLRQGKLYCESKERCLLEEFLDIPGISAARVPTEEEGDVSSVGGSGGCGTENVETTVSRHEGLIMVRCAAGEHDNTQLLELMNVGKSIESIGDQPDESGELDSRILWYYFEVRAAEAETVRREAKTAGYPVIEEYDFKSHTSLQKLSICLKPSTKVRPYQEKSLRRMFGNGRARSGVIVLPCGAGKTLVGCCAASTVQRSTIILCTSAVAVGQWRECLRTFTNIAESDIVCFTSAEKKSARSQSDQSRAQIFITTYSMMAAAKRSELSEATIAGIQAREWGLMVLDEVHVVPANTFRRVLFVCKAHCKLGLTATLVREDGLVADLSWMIGPKIYEANWAELTDQGYLARVKCEEVWCPMTAEFYREYLRNDDARKKRRLYVMNPSKLKATEALKVEHESRGDKIIVFSDDVLALQSYATKLDIPFICGQTKEQDRQRIFTAFRHSSVLNCIALSKVGDCAIDLPEASVIIQISSHFGSRRQEAQRLGRILRPSGAAPSHSQYDSYFYSLVSIDTDECFYSMKRQQFLSDQGYAFSVRESLPVASSSFSRQMGKAEELSMLEEALRVKEVLNRADNAEEDESAELRDEFERELQPVFRRNTRDISVLSGADDEVYIEYEGNRGFANKR